MGLSHDGGHMSKISAAHTNKSELDGWGREQVVFEMCLRRWQRLTKRHSHGESASVSPSTRKWIQDSDKSRGTSAVYLGDLRDAETSYKKEAA